MRQTLAELLSIDINSIHNPYAEWAKLVLKKFSERPNGDQILSFLKMLIQHDNGIPEYESPDYSGKWWRSCVAKGPNWQSFLDEARKEIGANPAEFEEILKLTVGEPGWCYEIGHWKSVDDMGDIFSRLCHHSEYHLDIILSESLHTKCYSGGSHKYEIDYFSYYTVRHKTLINKALREISHERDSNNRERA